MNVKKWAPLAIALVLGIVAVKLAMNFMPHHNSVAAAKPATPTMVVVCKQPIGPAQSIGPDDVALAPADPTSNPGDAFANVGQVVGRVSATPVDPGQVLGASMLIPKGEHAGLAAILPPGMRAMTVSITEITGVGGYIQPGCHVDVIESLNSGYDSQGHPKFVSLPIVQNVVVQAVGGRLNPNLPDGQGPATPVSHVTLLLTPAQAERVQLAVASGQPSLVLRGDGDNSPIDRKGVTVAELIEDDAPSKATTAQASSNAPAPAAQPAPTVTHTVVMIRGGEISAVVVKMPAPATQPDYIEASMPLGQ